MTINGLKVGAQQFSSETEELLKTQLQFARKTFVPGDEQFRGDRFNDDEKVLWAIRSGATEDEARTKTAECCIDGLKWAADMDYYYAFEKEWEE